MNWSEIDNIVDAKQRADSVLLVYGTDSPARSPHYAEMITSEELTYSENLKNVRQKEVWRSCRATLRAILGSRLNKDPLKIGLKKNSFGKLYVPDSNLYFSVCHTNNSFLLAFNVEGRIGVDMEYLSGNEDLSLLIEYAFSRQETDFCSQENRPGNFLKIWTLKEAYLKAMGTGLVDYLKSLNVYGDQENEISKKRLSQNSFICPNGETASIVYRNEKSIDYIWLK